MCSRTTCRSCAKPTYAGCGMHIEQVLGDVPKDERCTCREAKGQVTPKLGSSWLPGFFGNR